MENTGNKAENISCTADDMYGNDKVMHIDDDGIRYWLAREIGPLLGYKHYNKFEELVLRAQKKASDSGVDINKHFINEDYFSTIGHSHERKGRDFRLTSYACHLIAEMSRKTTREVQLARLFFHGGDTLGFEFISNEVERRNANYWRRLNQESSKWYQCKMMELDGLKDFVQDNTYLGHKAPNHIMYKLATINSKDGCRGYEFLIEYDIYEPTVGIYYGCKGLIYKGNQDEQMDIMNKEYNDIKDLLIVVLDNIFPGKSFAQRLKPTNNANNNTYWHFWITLYEDEDIIDVGARATRVIRNIYDKYFKGDIKGIIDSHIFKPRNKKPETITAFTNDAYDKLIDKIVTLFPSPVPDGKTKQTNVLLFEEFMKGCERSRIIHKSDLYEKAWMINDEINSNGETEILFVNKFTYLINTLFKNMEDNCTQKRGVQKTPWGNLEQIFLNKNGHSFQDKLRTYNKYIIDKHHPEIENLDEFYSCLMDGQE